ncbi:MAG: 2-hydroxyacid dehydrogenase [Paracoccaceae bacterium]
MRLLVTRPMPPAVEEAAKARFDCTLRVRNTPLSRAELETALRDYDAVLPTLGDLFAAPVFAAVPRPRARLLANFGVGYNHIDVPAARAAGVAVTNTPGAVTDATADIGVMLMLMTARRAGEGERLVRSGGWQGWHPTQMLGQHMSGKTVGIVGMGRIGKAVARRCHFGFGMTVRFFNRSMVADAGVPSLQVANLTDLAGQVDFLVLTLPGGAETRNIIGTEVLAAMRPTAILVNIARGDVLDESALIEALETGRIAGAGLDVYAREPDVPERLRAMENVVLLPHLGTAALEVRTAMGMMALDNVIALAEGRALPNAV